MSEFDFDAWIVKYEITDSTRHWLVDNGCQSASALRGLTADLIPIGVGGVANLGEKSKILGGSKDLLAPQGTLLLLLCSTYYHQQQLLLLLLLLLQLILLILLLLALLSCSISLLWSAPLCSVLLCAVLPLIPIFHCSCLIDPICLLPSLPVYSA